VGERLRHPGEQRGIGEATVDVDDPGDRAHEALTTAPRIGA
jgi:hypothetical protein